MTPNDTLATLFGCIFAVLVVASSIGAVLKFRLAPDAPSGTIDNLNARIKAWWWMIGLLAGALWIGKPGIIALFGFVSFQSLREYMSITYTRRGDHRALLWSFFFLLPLQYFLIAIDWYGLFSILIPVYAFLLLPISAALGADTTRFLERAAKVQWGLMICVYCLSHVPALLTLDIPGYAGRNALLVVFLVLTVQSSDVFQYVWGKLLGRHKVAPALSPSKQKNTLSARDSTISAWVSVSAVPQVETMCSTPACAGVITSKNPSQTMIERVIRIAGRACCRPKRMRPFWYNSVSAVFRYFGPSLPMRRPPKPMTSPASLRTGNRMRLRKKS